MTKENICLVKILRFDPDKDASSYFQDFFIPFEKEETVLDCLYYIYSHIDGSLSFRGSCFTGWCRVCMLKLNGSAVFPCKRWMEKKMVIEPLPNYPIIKDLVVDFKTQENKTQYVQKSFHCKGPLLSIK